MQTQDDLATVSKERALAAEHAAALEGAAKGASAQLRGTQSRLAALESQLQVCPHLWMMSTVYHIPLM